ncbi:hypothetical protein SAMN02745136_02205 [Anaerocolumna jejuensis DSM 15929]|uniref:Uncharacterized protein n=1 Tax=Anaerocolumna jejuensis DSM 15929 TaxID=1121322 RepID=A0A1M6RAD7_9FIRM|nr:hypothetical protein SAMN02745136_02205 [Anaerocolumna jejuensis DSM 15929]
MTLKLQETQLGKTAQLFERSEFCAVLTVSCVFCSFSGIKVLEERTPNQFPSPARQYLSSCLSINWIHMLLAIDFI